MNVFYHINTFSKDIQTALGIVVKNMKGKQSWKKRKEQLQTRSCSRAGSTKMEQMDNVNTGPPKKG